MAKHRQESRSKAAPSSRLVRIDQRSAKAREVTPASENEQTQPERSVSIQKECKLDKRIAHMEQRVDRLQLKMMELQRQLQFLERVMSDRENQTDSTESTDSMICLVCGHDHPTAHCNKFSKEVIDMIYGIEGICYECHTIHNGHCY